MQFAVEKCAPTQNFGEDCVGMEDMGTKSLIKVVPSFVLLISFITQEQNAWEVRIIGKRQQMGYMTNTTKNGCVTLWPCHLR